MKNICKKLALLFLPVALYLCFFVAFEPNNYFGLRHTSGSTQPIARLRAYQQTPGENLFLGDSRLAHLDMAQVSELTGQSWQNLAFGGASLRECIDLADYVLQNGSHTRRIVLGLSFYTVNGKYDTDRLSALEDTLNNPLAYIFNLEYNVNTLTNFTNFLIWAKQRAGGVTTQSWAEAQQENETGTWSEADYLAPDGTRYPVHALLAEYPPKLIANCEGWYANEAMLEELEALAVRCAAQGVQLTLVLPPMAGNVRREICDVYGITEGMQPILTRLAAWQAAYGVAVLDYEWQNQPVFDEDKQFFDGFHLDTVHGLPQWTAQLCNDLA